MYWKRETSKIPQLGPDKRKTRFLTETRLIKMCRATWSKILSAPTAALYVREGVNNLFTKSVRKLAKKQCFSVFKQGVPLIC